MLCDHIFKIPLFCVLLAIDVLDKIYFPILVPVGVVGNFLSFLVSKGTMVKWNKY